MKVPFLSALVLTLLLPLTPAWGFDLQGFMDVSYQYSPSKKAEEPLKNGGFLLGQLDLFAAHNVTDRLDVLSELVFEAPAGEMLVDIERIEAGYAFAEWLNVRAGRFHTPLGYYANVYHHGRILDSTVTRPLILEFEDEGGLVPAHIVGLWARGHVRAGPATIKHTLGVANGQQVDMDDGELMINMTSDDNANKVVLANVAVEPEALKGVGLGASAYSGKVNGYSEKAAGDTQLDVSQLIGGANLYYDESPLQFIAELYLLRDKDELASPSKTYTSAGYFFQAGYDLAEKYRPYARYESLLPKDNDPYAEALVGKDDISRLTFGFRYRFLPESSLKAEGIWEKRGEDNVAILSAQWAFLF